MIKENNAFAMKLRTIKTLNLWGKKIIQWQGHIVFITFYHDPKTIDTIVDKKTCDECWAG
jgi:3-polyprenyl-4-hydroxybenzoate decarboxylase